MKQRLHEDTDTKYTSNHRELPEESWLSQSADIYPQLNPESIRISWEIQELKYLLAAIKKVYRAVISVKQGIVNYILHTRFTVHFYMDDFIFLFFV